MNKKVKEALKVIEENCCAKIEGNRIIAVLDKGWIFVGYLAIMENGYFELSDAYNLRKWQSGGFGISIMENGYFELSDAYNLRKWQSGGFGMVCTDPKKAQVTLDKSNDIKFRKESMIFSVSISEDWGK